METPPGVSQAITILGKEHVSMFGMVNGYVVVLGAMVDHALDSDTDLVLGGAALQQLYDARRRITENNDINVFEIEHRNYA